MPGMYFGIRSTTRSMNLYQVPATRHPQNEESQSRETRELNPSFVFFFTSQVCFHPIFFFPLHPSSYIYQVLFELLEQHLENKERKIKGKQEKRNPFCLVFSCFFFFFFCVFCFLLVLPSPPACTMRCRTVPLHSPPLYIC